MLNLLGFLVGFGIGTVSLIGFVKIGSPTLFRITVAFFSISAGFLVVWVGYMTADPSAPEEIERWIQALGIGIQTVGYFFIAFSHSIKSFFPRSRYLRSVAILPLFFDLSVQLEHIFRSISFILLAYGAIETFLSYLESRNKWTISVLAGLSMLALGEFLGWYSLLFPGSILYPLAISIKIAGLIALFLPVSRMPMTSVKFDGWYK